MQDQYTFTDQNLVLYLKPLTRLNPHGCGGSNLTGGILGRPILTIDVPPDTEAVSSGESAVKKLFITFSIFNPPFKRSTAVFSRIAVKKILFSCYAGDQWVYPINSGTLQKRYAVVNEI
jgi:hypothetical protein